MLLNDELGRFLRRNLPAIWVDKPNITAPVAIVVGVALAFWQAIWPEFFEKSASKMTAIFLTYTVFLFSAIRENIPFPFSSQGISSRIAANFEIDGITRRPIKGYFEKVLWRTLLVLCSFPAFASANYGTEYLLFAFSLVCVSCYRMGMAMFLPATLVIASIPIGIVTGIVYKFTEHIDSSSPIISIICGLVVNGIVVAWSWRKNSFLPEEFWSSIGVSLAHLPFVTVSVILAFYFGLGQFSNTAAEPYFPCLVVFSFLAGPLLIMLSDYVAARPGANVSTAVWRQN